LKARSHVAGIDGGASKTVALIADGNGKILGSGRAGPSNYHNVGVQAATLAIKNSLQRAKSKAGITGRTDTAVVALAGIDSEQDLRTVSQFVKNARIASTSIVIHDSVAAIYAAMKGRPGIVVNSGTGSFAAGINSKGAYARAGGWGYIVGDEGSAYDIGVNAIKMAFRSFDGRERNTELIEILRHKFHIRKMDDLVSQIYSHKLSVEQIAAVAPLVIRSAWNDKMSRRILDEAGTQLGELVCAVAVRLHMTQQEFSVAAVGGNFRSRGHLIQALRSKIGTCCPSARVIHMRVEPAHGSLSLALEAFRKRN
jgi:N-acetylglucosamine kinase-like BadF-type ATPase